MKRRADLLVNGVYKRITIWDALDMKKNQADFWEEYKDSIYSICKKPENKERMIFITGKNGVLKNSYFRYYSDIDVEHRGVVVKHFCNTYGLIIHYIISGFKWRAIIIISMRTYMVIPDIRKFFYCFI